MARRRRSGGRCTPGPATTWPPMAIEPVRQPLDTGQAAQQRRLARPGRPQQDQERARVDVEVHVREGRLWPRRTWSPRRRRHFPRRSATVVGSPAPQANWNATPPTRCQPRGARRRNPPETSAITAKTRQQSQHGHGRRRCRSGSCSPRIYGHRHRLLARRVQAAGRSEVRRTSWSTSPARPAPAPGTPPGRKPSARPTAALAPWTRAASSNEVCTWATWPTMMRDCVGTLVAR